MAILRCNDKEKQGWPRPHMPARAVGAADIRAVPQRLVLTLHKASRSRRKGYKEPTDVPNEAFRSRRRHLRAAALCTGAAAVHHEARLNRDEPSLARVSQIVQKPDRFED